MPISVKFSIKCSDLLNKDVGSLSDPICAVFGAQGGGEVKELGRTDIVMNSLNPQFKRTVEVVVDDPSDYKLTFKVYDVDFLKSNEAVLSEDNLLGTFSADLKSILDDEDHIIEGTLEQQGAIVITAEHNVPRVASISRPAAVPTSMREKRKHVRTNVYISKGLPASLLDTCRTELGEEVADLCVQLYDRRGMLDLFAVPESPTSEMWEETWYGGKVVDGNKPNRDPRGEGMVKSLIAALKTSGKKFTDPHFPPDNSSLFADPRNAFANAGAEATFRKDQDPFLAGVSGIEWKRPADILDKSAKPVMFSGKIDPDDVAQGRLGNCYFLAAIASCAEGKDDLLLRDLIIEDGFEQGIIGFKFYVNGRWTTVVIDDYFPCTLSGGQWKPIFAGPRSTVENVRGEKELWAMAFEKAWAKLHQSYEATAGGLTEDAHHYLTAGMCSELAVGSKTDEEFRAIQEMLAGGESAFLSTSTREGMADTPKNGLIDGHAYSLLEVRESSVGKMVQVRNPWGNNEWKGDFSRNSTRWTPALKQELNEDGQDDGSFWMTWPDFYKHFAKVTICDPRSLCKMYEDQTARMDGVSSQWVARKSAGGRPAHSTFQYNPHFKLVVKGPEVLLTLMQPDVRYHDKVESMTEIEMSLWILDAELFPSRSKEAKEVFKMEYTRQKAIKFDVVPDKEYIVIASAWGPGVQSSFVITACGYDCTLTPMPLVEPTPEMADRMALQKSRETLCCFSGKPVEGSYYPVPEGKLLPEFFKEYRVRRAAGGF